jgi:diguanylate cyclase (GGDEF)-like protein/PAS domain S-box-containing protein
VAHQCCWPRHCTRLGIGLQVDRKAVEEAKMSIGEDSQGAPDSPRSIQIRSQTAERVLRALNQFTRQVWLFVSPALEIEWVSDGIIDVLGYQPEEIIGTSGLDLVHSDDLGFVAALAVALPDERPRDVAHRRTANIRLRRKDGDHVTLTIHISHALEEEGVNALIIQMTSPDQALEIARAVRSAAQGAPLAGSLETLARSLGLNRPDDIKAVIIDNSGHVLAQSGRSTLDAKEPFNQASWAMGEGCVWVTPIVDGASSEQLGNIVCALPTTTPPPFDVRSAIDVAAYASVLIRGQRDRDQLELAALTDPLTGIYNRNGFTEHLSKQTTSFNEHHVLFVDLDDFKQVNDTHGHHVGDEVLRVVAQRLRHAVREDDMVARLGGDEFAVSMRSFASPAALVDRLRAAVTLEPILVGELNLQIKASFGISSNEADPIRALELADRSMYQAKAKSATA